jgi:hypothetical protein
MTYVPGREFPRGVTMTKAAVLLLTLPLAGCSIVIGGRPDVCGVYPEGGGPAVIVTRDQELCEVVRIRVTNGLASLPELSQVRIEELLERTRSWEDIRTIDRLVEALREDAGEGFAADVQRAVEAVARQSTRGIDADCAADEQRCMVRGAVRGVRIALLNAEPVTPAGEPAPKRPVDVY